MPSYAITSPDGKKYKVTVPEGVTSEQVMQQFQAQRQTSQNAPQQLAAKLAARPTENGMLENFGRGLVQGGKSAVSGVLGLGADIAGAIAPGSESIQQFRELLPEAQSRSNIQYQAATGDSTAAGIGNILGQAAPYMAMPASAATLAGRVGLGAAGGAVAGATAPSEIQQTPEEALAGRAKGAAMGAAIGGVVPAAITGVAKGVPAAVRKLADINPIAAKDFIDSGVEASVGALSKRPSIQLADKWMSKFVSSAGVMQKSTEKTLDDIQNLVKQAGATKGVTTQEAGRIIQQGGANYISRFQDASSKLYNKVDKYIKPDLPVPVANATTELQNILAKAGTPNLLARLEKNAGVRVLKEIGQDASSGTLPYNALKNYRTIIGQELSSPHLIGGTEIPIYKQAYAALTKDMEAAAASAGPKAQKAFEKANTFYRKGITEIENNLQGTLLKNAPEDAYQAAIAGTSRGGTRINSIMKSLKPGEREIIRGTVLNKLGLAKAGAQDATGEAFSTNTFLTNWNKMSPEAKRAIFGNKETANALDNVARISDTLNKMDRFGNPSGTAQQVGFSGVLVGLLTAPISTTAGLLGANATARLMTNQQFVRWLATAAAAKTPQAVNNNLSRLSTIAKQNPAIAKDIAHYITMVGIVGTRNKE